MRQCQGDQEQKGGDQIAIQGDQKQKQYQGDQFQYLKGHGGQCIGDQQLINAPSISAPINVNVDCNRCEKQCDCHDSCKETSQSLLFLIRTLSNLIEDPFGDKLCFYTKGPEECPLFGSLAEVTDCTFLVLNCAPITVMISALEALKIQAAIYDNDLFCDDAPGADLEQEAVVYDDEFLCDDAPEADFEEEAAVYDDEFLCDDALAADLEGEAIGCGNDLFSLLLDYLCARSEMNNEPCEKKEDDCDCVAFLRRQLQNYLYLPLEVQTETHAFAGILYGIFDDVVFLFDDCDRPTAIYAIPLCKIVSYRLI